MNITLPAIPSCTAFVSIKILEIGAGNVSVGRYSGQFTTQLLFDKLAQNMILNYANKVIPRPWKGQFNHVLALSTDRKPHRHIHFKMDANQIQFPDHSFHFVVSVGPRLYGFRDEFTGFELLKSISRILCRGGEFHIFGNYENPWFNMDMGSKEGQNKFKKIAWKTGFCANYFLHPIRFHPWRSLFKNSEHAIITLACRGRQLKTPTHFHLLIKK